MLPKTPRITKTEVDHYIALPGQVLACKLGQLEILKLREEARQKLGSKFNIRDFPDEVLGDGALPFDVLHSDVEDWITNKRGVDRLSLPLH